MFVRFRTIGLLVARSGQEGFLDCYNFNGTRDSGWTRGDASNHKMDCSTLARGIAT